MNHDPLTGIAVLDATIEFADRSESRVLEILERADDRSSMSDELAAHITDWPTRYHFSRARGHLLRPIEVRGDMRVLDVGAGTGVVARSLAERGARVVALEGSLDRARAAATRCADLDAVEVICGSLNAYEDDTGDGFDLVCFVGVLEYAGSGAGGRRGAGAALDRARALLRPGGAVVVAVENQLGLKYLLGYPEDHLGRPFAGVEGYLGSDGVRTWSRRALEHLLSDHGLDRQQWLYPYPDYKLPAAVLAEAAFSEPDAVTLVDALVRRPSSEDAGARPTACDERAAHRVFLEAGLGPHVANSFLVVASPGDDGAPSLVPDDTLAWFFGRERLRSWMRRRELTTIDGARRIRTEPADPDVAARRRGWLRQRQQREDPFRSGATVEQLALEACHEGDLDRLGEVLGRWWQHLDGAATVREPGSAGHNPFLPADSPAALPADHLDVSLSNLVDADDGELVFVDREWVAEPGVEPQLVALRALWYFAADLVADGVPHPFNPESSVDELALALADAAGIDVAPADLDRLRDAEADLQATVTGRDRAAVAESLAWTGRRHPLDGSVVRRLPFSRLQRALSRFTLEGDEDAPQLRELEGLRLRAEALGDTCRDLEAEVEAYRSGNLDLEAAVGSLSNELETTQELLAEQTADRDRAVAETTECKGLLGEIERQTADLRAEAARLEQESNHHREIREVLRAEVEALRLQTDRTQIAEELRCARGRIAELTAEREQLRDRLEDARAAVRSAARSAEESLTQHEIHRTVDASRITDLSSQVEDLRHRLHAAGGRIAELEGEVGHWRLWRDAFDRRLPVRLYRSLFRRGDTADR